LGRIAGNSQSFPKEVKYGDIVKGLPVADNSFRCVYASHVLEHLALHDFRKALRNTFNILEPGGVFCELGDADDVMFAQVEDPGRFIDQSLDLRELAIEARKPSSTWLEHHTSNLAQRE
jgi:ubiquinone/menaquinone biosynthesis C-methylase UbiE